MNSEIEALFLIFLLAAKVPDGVSAFVGGVAVPFDTRVGFLSRSHTVTDPRNLPAGMANLLARAIFVRGRFLWLIFWLVPGVAFHLT